MDTSDSEKSLMQKRIMSLIEKSSLKSIISTLRSPKRLKIDECYEKSYSQSGEDVIVKFIFQCLGIDRPTYIDIGANHPFSLSNTALFYLTGSRGINIEPDPELFALLQKFRKQDINLNIGISNQKGFMDFYVMLSPTMSTFSLMESEMLKKETSLSVRHVIKTKTDTLTNVLNDYSQGVFPDFLSLDVEGLEESIIESIDYHHNFPKVICIETLTYTENNTEIKEQGMINTLLDKGYIMFADTYINSIFVRQDLWKSRTR